uniref:Uncharacterized protein n=1 Tax=Rousettus aegyptiacus TaxID=9407 RepID=A0A7J8JI69_ROUAE|nr:hypothetical protein HJG63_010398 [Rousettus aegyptiacus]
MCLPTVLPAPGLDPTWSSLPDPTACPSLPPLEHFRLVVPHTGVCRGHPARSQRVVLQEAISVTSSIIKSGKLPIAPASTGFRSSLSIVRALENCSFTPSCLVSLRPFYDTVVRWFRASSGEHMQTRK